MLAPAWPALAVQRRQQFSNNHANLLKDWHCSEKSSTSTTLNAVVKLGLHFSTWRRLNVPDMLEESSSFYLEYQIGNKSLFNVQKQKAIWYTSEARDIAAIGRYIASDHSIIDATVYGESAVSDSQESKQSPDQSWLQIWNFSLSFKKKQNFH